jgi:hypothetical protein
MVGCTPTQFREANEGRYPNAYSPMSGSQLRYNVFAGEKLVACLSFGASAWKLKDRERFIGWSEAKRSRHLRLVVNNARFLILPWVRSLGRALCRLVWNLTSQAAVD